MTTQTFWAHGSALRTIRFSGGTVAALDVNEYGATIVGGAVGPSPVNLSLTIPCPVSINGVQGKVLNGFLKYRHMAPGPVAIIDVRLMDGDTEIALWPGPLAMPPSGADHVEKFQLQSSVAITCGLALTFRVDELPGAAKLEIIGAGVEIQY